MSTKIHLVCDALGNPVRLLAGSGQQGEVLRAAELIKGLACGHVIADRAYDAEHFHDTVLDAAAVPVAPLRPNRRRPRTDDRIATGCRSRPLSSHAPCAEPATPSADDDPVDRGRPGWPSTILDLE